jgi:Ser/Thr protein kinase RdoA (MazF antagonist)
MTGVDPFLDAAQRAIALFGIMNAQITRLGASENVAFRVVEPVSGAAYSLRLHRPSYHSPEALASERQWVRALLADGVRVPAVVPAVRGGDIGWVDTGEGDPRAVSLSRWIDGDLLSDRLASSAGSNSQPWLYRALGRLVGRLHSHASQWRSPEDFVRPRSDIEGLLGPSSSWGRFWENAALRPDERGFLLSCRDRMASVLEAYGTGPEVFGLIHSDLHPGNTVCTTDDVAVIDFDDAAFGWRLADIATAAFDIDDDGSRADALELILQGYSETCSLAVDRSLFPLFHAFRALALLGWLHQRPDLNSPARSDLMRLKALKACAGFRG